MEEKSARDIRAEAEAALARFDEADLIGSSVEDASKWCQVHGFRVLLEKENGPTVMSRNINRVRLTIRDGLVIAARLG